MLYNRDKGACSVAILHEGERLNIPVDPGDPCFYEETDFLDTIKQNRFWVEDPVTGERTTEGVVKAEYEE